MNTISTQELAGACRIFMTLAYPEGPSTIPLSKRAYAEIAVDGCLADYLPPTPKALAVCQDLSRAGGMHGYEFRLGSAAYPHLKLRVQLMDLHESPVWVYSVNTHDGFFHASSCLSAEEADAWKALVERNRSLKHQIETALAEAGYMTPVRLLRVDLTPTNPS